MGDSPDKNSFPQYIICFDRTALMYIMLSVSSSKSNVSFEGEDTNHHHYYIESDLLIYNFFKQDETHDIINDLRDEISKLRDKIASQSQPNKDDVLKMEALVQDLQIAKRSTWDEREKQSHKYQSERKTNLANKVCIAWMSKFNVFFGVGWMFVRNF